MKNLMIAIIVMLISINSYANETVSLSLVNISNVKHYYKYPRETPFVEGNDNHINGIRIAKNKSGNHYGVSILHGTNSFNKKSTYITVDYNECTTSAISLCLGIAVGVANGYKESTGYSVLPLAFADISAKTMLSDKIGISISYNRIPKVDGLVAFSSISTEISYHF